LKTIFAGDISFDWLPQPRLSKRLLSFKSKLNYQTDIISGGLSGLFKSADLVCANLECALTDRGEALSGKKYRLRAEPRYIGVLKELHISLVCLANNHILDYGREGLDDTIKHLESVGINYCGLKNKTDQNPEPYIYTDSTSKVAIFNYVEPGIIDPDPDIFFNFDKHPVPLEREQILTDIKRYSKDHTVIVIPHWGEEWSFGENGCQRKLAHMFIDNGAVAVIGHHSHLAGMIEKYKDGLVAYGLGNLYMMLPDFSGLRAKRRLAVELDIQNNKLNGYKLIPLTSNNETTPVVDDEIISVSFYKDYRPSIFPDKDKTIFDSLESIKNANVTLESSGQMFNAEYRDSFYNEPKVVQGKLPFAPGWRIKDKFWCGIINSREFMGDSFLDTNVTHLYDDVTSCSAFEIDRSFSKLHLAFGYPEWFYFIDEFICPEFDIMLNNKPVYNFKPGDKLTDWSFIDIDVSDLIGDKNKLEIIVKGKKDKFAYIGWRILAF